MTGLIDYGVGNLFSLKSSLAAIGEEAAVTSDLRVLREADRIILPGVGAFADAMEKLKDAGLDNGVRELALSKPLLGICLGMQLLFDESFEFGRHRGLGLIPGKVVPIESAPGFVQGYKIPHIGWNSLTFDENCPLFAGLRQGEHVYFVHSYYADCPGKYVSAVTEYGASLTAAVRRNNIFGCQFHPEKSGAAGLSILKAFCGINGA